MRPRTTEQPEPPQKQLPQLIAEFLLWIPLFRGLINVVEGRSLVKLGSWTGLEGWVAAAAFSLVGTCSSWFAEIKLPTRGLK